MGVSQQTVSNTKNNATIEADLVKIVGDIPEGIENFSEDAVFNIITNTFLYCSTNNNNCMCSIDTIDKIIELYERLLEPGKSKVTYLEKRLKNWQDQYIKKTLVYFFFKLLFS